MIDNNKVIIARNAQRTSIEAAMRVLPKTGSLRRRLYEYLLRQGMNGATDQEMEKALHIPGNTIRPTRLSLLKEGYIMDTGLTRVNDQGNKCIVYRSAEEGMLL